MSVAQTRWALIGLIVFWVILTAAFPGERRTVGISAEWVNGEYRFSGGTDPAALGMAALMIGAYILAFNTRFNEDGRPVKGVFRRFVAFWFDFLIAMMAISPLVGILPSLLEWKRTGAFQWTFERTVATWGDSLQLGLLLPLTVAALICYYALPLLLRRPSPGACIMGYRVVPDDGAKLTARQAMLRSLLGFIAVCSAYLVPFVGRDKNNGKFWLDKAFSTHAIDLR